MTDCFPWKRTPGTCELCGRKSDQIVRIVIEPGEGIRVADNRAGRTSRTGLRLARAIYVCPGLHIGGITNGAPVTVPRKTTMERPPKQLALFDSALYLKQWRT
jgi:hypothetical protein